MSFDPVEAGNAAKLERQLRRGRNYTKRTSKLEPFRAEIVSMFTSDQSLDLIAIHLHSQHGQKVARSTIHRYLKSIGVTRNG